MSEQKFDSKNNQEESTVSSELKPLLCPRYAPVHFNMLEHENGTWLRVADVVTALDFMLDNDDVTVTRLHEMLDYLRA